jgi:hypothetical protein
MAEITAYNLELSEVIAALIRQQGLHEGKWTIGVNFGFAAALAGPQPSDTRPAAIVQIQSLQLARVTVEGMPQHLVVDAAEVNPKT